jgi:hypothetical protein
MEDVLNRGWNRPWHKVPFIVFLLLIACSAVPWLRPAAPIGAVISFVAWLIRPNPSFWRQALRAVIIPVSVGLALASIGGIIVNQADQQIVAAETWEVSIIRLAGLLKPLGDPSLRNVIIGATAGIVLSLFLKQWKLSNRALTIQKLAAKLFLVLVTCASFSFFAEKPLNHVAVRKVAELRGEYLKAKLSFDEWEHRVFQYTALEEALERELKTHPELNQDLTNLAATCNSSKTIAKPIDNWFNQRFQAPPPPSPVRPPSDSSGPTDGPGFSFRPSSSQSHESWYEGARENAPSPLFSKSEMLDNEFPTAAQWHEAKTVVQQLETETVLNEEVVAGRFESIRMLLSKVVETTLSSASLLTEAPFPNQLAQKFIDTLIDRLPIESWHGRLTANFQYWLDQCRSEKGNLATKAETEAPITETALQATQTKSETASLSEEPGLSIESKVSKENFKSDDIELYLRRKFPNSPAGLLDGSTAAQSGRPKDWLPLEVTDPVTDPETLSRAMIKESFDYRMRAKLSREEYTQYEQKPEAYATKFGFVCPDCGRPWWTPGCKRVP